VSGRAPRINARGNVAVRLEAIDALETHFSGTHQELAGANAGRDRLLAGLGFTNVRFWPDLPNRVRSADRDSVRGHVLSNGVDADGRVVAFVHPGDGPKLFRRIVPYLAGGFGDFDGFDAWLRAEPVDRDDELFLLDQRERVRLHDVVRASGDEIALEAWPEDFVISPDPPP
jgi:hypothetical protein